MEDIELIKSRHSVRSYLFKEIEDEKKREINDLISEINKEIGSHIQVFYKENECFSSFLAHYGKFENVSNYISLIGNKKDKDIETKLGYFGEKIVLKLQSLGLSSCWVALTHGASKAKREKNEKEYILISFGYSDKKGVERRSKGVVDVVNSLDIDENIINGIKASLLAPTAMNQQKFYFIVDKDNKVFIYTKKGFYTKIDLGIVAYHFELVSKIKLENLFK